MADLWPDDLTEVRTKAPVSVLREQATLLGAKTKNLVTAKLRDADALESIRREYGPFSFSFRLVAPALGGYQYRLFDATYDVSLYPVRVFLDDEIAKELEMKAGTPLVIESEDDLLSTLERVFKSAKTRQVIHAILAQSAASK